MVTGSSLEEQRVIPSVLPLVTPCSHFAALLRDSAAVSLPRRLHYCVESAGLWGGIELIFLNKLKLCCRRKQQVKQCGVSPWTVLFFPFSSALFKKTQPGRTEYQWQQQCEGLRLQPAESNSARNTNKTSRMRDRPCLLTQYLHLERKNRKDGAMTSPGVTFVHPGRERLPPVSSLQLNPQHLWGQKKKAQVAIYCWQWAFNVLLGKPNERFLRISTESPGHLLSSG